MFGRWTNDADRAVVVAAEMTGRSVAAAEAATTFEEEEAPARTTAKEEAATDELTESNRGRIDGEDELPSAAHSQHCH